MAFFEFNIAVSGLFAAQRGLSVTSNNIANTTTKGYSRQELGQSASIPLTGCGVGMLGTGVITTDVKRIRDSYIDSKLWSQNDKLGEYKIKVEQNSIIETVYGEPSETGFTKVFTDFFTGIDDLSKLPDEGERKTGLRQQMISFTKYFNQASTSLSGFQQDLNFELKSKVDEINLLGSKIQSLNSQIYQSEIYGDDANTFRDARDLCVDRLSELVNVQTKEEEEVTVSGKVFKKFSVKVAGQTLVDHLAVRELGIYVRGSKEDEINALTANIANITKATVGVTPTPVAMTTAQINSVQDSLAKIKQLDPTTVTTGNVLTDTYTITAGSPATQIAANGVQTDKLSYKLNPEDVDGLYDVVWKDGLNFDMTDANMSGELKGVIDMRDGRGTGSADYYNGIPYYIKRMDNYVRTIAETMNEIYSTDADGYIELENALIPSNPSVFMKKDASGTIKYYAADKTALTGVPPVPPNTYQPKYQLFTYTNGNTTGSPETDPNLTDGYKLMTAAGFSISKEIFDSSGNIRTNYEHYINGGTVVNPNPAKHDLLADLNAQKDNKKMFKEGNPKDYMIAIFSELGINAQEAKMYQSSQTSITNNITNQRLSISQVDQNEEFINLVKYQQAYQAAAKIINTIDGIYETTIFKLGNF